MSKIISNVKYLKVLVSPKSKFKDEQNEVIKLYQDRKIENFKTAEKIIDQLHSRGTKKNEQGLASLSKYSNVEPAKGKISRQIDIKKQKAKPLVTKVDRKNLDKALSSLVFHIKPDQTVVSSIMKNPTIIEEIKAMLKRKKSMKMHLGSRFEVCRTLQYDLVRDEPRIGINSRIVKRKDENGNIEELEVKESDPYSMKTVSVQPHNLINILDDQADKLNSRLRTLATQEGSEWNLFQILTLFIKGFTIKPLRASSYIPTPEKYNHPRCGLINIQNKDQECFKWCCKYHQSTKVKNNDRISVLRQLDDKYDYSNVNFPSTFDDIATFEENNKVSVFVYYVDENEIRIEKEGNRQYVPNDRIYLLRIEHEDQSHYVYIKHIERLFNLHHHVTDKDKKFCPYCNGKVKLSEFNKHLSDCNKRCEAEGSLLKLPEPGSVMKFKNFKNKLERPFIVYADTECTLVKTNDPNKIHEHVVNSCCFQFVCSYDSSKNRLWHSTDADCITQMIRELYTLGEWCNTEMRKNQDMKMTPEDKQKFRDATCCSICNGCFCEKDIKVRDHDHRTGEFRGASHNKCNINYFNNRFLPVVFHNLRGYDSHLIIREAYKIADTLGSSNPQFKVIPNSYEKFMSFDIGMLKFIDSFQFMASSLESLVENLYTKDDDDKYSKFNVTKTMYSEHMDLLCRKGFYPYEWFDNTAKFDYDGLPPKEEFYSQLSQKHISDDDYKHAEHVYETLNCQSFKDYHLAYLKCDVLLLTDVFESFRSTCLTNYELDPANYISAASLAWDAMLLKTGTELELISDPKILDIIERQKKGGLCYVGSKRHVVANNHYFEDFNPEKPEDYLLYLDANNLYGWAMVQQLPYKDLKFDNDVPIETVLETSDDSETGFIIECDLIFPEELHDKFKEFPPCPENICPKLKWLS